MEILLFGMALVTASYFFDPVDMDNVSSRFFMVSSIVDHGTLSIDAYKDQTIDASFFGGRYYSSKSIGTTVLGVPVYWVLRHIPPFRDQPPLTVPQRYVVRVVTTSLPFAILAIAMFRLARRLGAAPRTAVWMVLAYSFGTIALVHASIFSGHQIAASFSFFAFAILAYLRQRTTSHHEIGLALGAGVLAVLAALADYTAMFTVVVLTIYGFSARIRPRSKLAFLLGGALGAAVLAGYNWKCFGSVFSVSYAHQVTESFREGSRQGFLGISVPKGGPFFKLLLSPSRGLFFIMPVFLFSVFGFIRMWNRKELRPEALVIFSVSVGYLAINSGFYGWGGGAAYGPRYLVPMLPFLAVPMIFAGLDSRWFLLAFGASVSLVAPAMIGLAEMHESIMNPIVEVIVPCISQGCLSENLGSWLGLEFPWSILPIVTLSIALGWYAIHHLTTAAQRSTMPWVEKAGVGTWLGVIAVMLLTVRTFPPELVADECATAHYNLGGALVRLGKLQEAMGHWEQALRLKPDLAEAHNNLGTTLARLDRLPEAIEHWEQALRIKPDYAEAHYNLGLALEQTGRRQDAIRHYEQALRIRPGFVEAQNRLARLRAIR